MTESTSDGSTLWRRAILSTSAFTVALGPDSAFGTGGCGGGVGRITFSGTVREAITALRTRRPPASARTTVVTLREGESDVGGAAWSPKAANTIAHSVKQNLMTLFNRHQNTDPSL